jgi:2-C-methyl-D-erythritol 4-phosphate cytidylyltransferase
MHESTAVILLAGGSGSRMGHDQAKQFIRIAGKPVLVHSHDALRRYMPHARMVVVAPVDTLDAVRAMFTQDTNTLVVAGGSSRQASTLKGLHALRSHAPSHVLIHDAARPFLSGQIILDVLQALEKNEAVDVAIPTADTIIVERDGYIQSIPKRQHLLRGQTPQAFKYQTLLRCYEEIGEERLDQFTDDCGIYLECNPMGRVRIVKGHEENIKITNPIDLTLADEMFRLRSQTCSGDKPGVNLRGKRVLIFGGTRGIGKALADIMRSAGAQVVVCSRENGYDITREADVSLAMRETAESLGGLDVVVNAAGLLRNGLLSEQDGADIEEQVAINFTGALNVARHAYGWLKQSQGTLLLFSSTSYTRGRAGYVTYSATKAAIVNLTQGLSEEWAADGIRVNCVIPGRTDTEMRKTNFQSEAQDTLFSPYQIALTASKVIAGVNSGQIERIH